MPGGCKAAAKRARKGMAPLAPVQLRAAEDRVRTLSGTPQTSAMLYGFSKGPLRRGSDGSAVRTPASPWGGTRDRVGGRDGLQRRVEAIHAAATQRALSRHLNLFAQLNAARSAAGTRYASAPRSDGARSYLTGKEGGRDSAGTTARQRGSRCLQGAGEKRSFCSWLKNPTINLHAAEAGDGERLRAEGPGHS